MISVIPSTNLKYILKGIDTFPLLPQHFCTNNLKYILKGIDTSCSQPPAMDIQKFEIYPKRN